MKTRTSSSRPLLLGALLLASSQGALQAQQYSIGWAATQGANRTGVIGLGGGGTMAGGQYNLSASIGQVGAGGPGAGGNYVVDSGFWEKPGGPELCYQLNNPPGGPPSLTISWGAAALGCFVLQQTSSIDPQLVNWVGVPNAEVSFANGVDSVTVTLTDSTAQYYRLVSPCGI